MTGMTVREVLALPAVVDVPTAGRVFDIKKDSAYKLAHSGGFPVPVLASVAACASRARRC